jgi:ClpP class serine protease
MMLPHLTSRLYGTPLLLAQAQLDIVLAALGARIGWPEPHTAVAVPAPRVAPEALPGTAVIPLYGMLVRRTLGLEAASGLTSYGEIGALLDATVANPEVTGILLNVDSPGGEAGGVSELGQRIRSANALKPVCAIAAESAFSGAYVLASVASRVYVTQTGGVGSIGVIVLHVDQSARDAQQGYRDTAITFSTYVAPADFNETVNTLRQPLYAKHEPRKFDRGTDLHTQSKPLPMCHRPGVLVKLVMQ